MNKTLRTLGTLNYERCGELLGSRAERRLADNTRLRRSAGGYEVVFWRTTILTFRADGGIVLNSGGHRTSTTKERIRQLAGADLYQKGGVWFIGDTPFRDGMTI